MKKPIARPADPLEETLENPDLPPIAAAQAVRRKRTRPSSPRWRLKVALGMVVVAVAVLIRHVGA